MSSAIYAFVTGQQTSIVTDLVMRPSWRSKSATTHGRSSSLWHDSIRLFGTQRSKMRVSCAVTWTVHDSVDT
jgi:hypothetical protein